MSIDELVAVCPPPKSPVHARGEWSAVEAKLGALPADYRALIETYGSGSFGDLTPLNPFDPNEHVDLIRAGQGVLAGDRHTRKTHFDHLESLPLHPDAGGFLPCALLGNGGHVYWRTNGDPDAWPVYVLPSRELRGTELAMSLTSLLARWLDGRETPDGLGEVDEVHFEPSAAPAKRIEVYFNPIADERETAAARIAKHLGKTKSKGKHVSASSGQWHFLAGNDWKITFNHHGEGFAQLWIDVPPADESVLEPLIVAIPDALGWTYRDIVTVGERDTRVPTWLHVPRTEPQEDSPVRSKAKPKTTSKSKSAPKKKSK